MRAAQHQREHIQKLVAGTNITLYKVVGLPEYSRLAKCRREMTVSLLEPFFTIVVLLYKKIKCGMGKIRIRPEIYCPYLVYGRPSVEFLRKYKKMPKKQFFFNFGDVFLRGEVSV